MCGRLAFSAVLVLVTGFFAIAQSPWWWVAVGACAALLTLVLVCLGVCSGELGSCGTRNADR
jgi:hypothetical protein